MIKRNKKRLIKASVIFIFAGILAVPVLMGYLTRQAATATGTLAPPAAIKKFGFYFEEVSKQSGVNFVHHSPKLDPQIDPILPQIASVGASVSVCDFDNDGWNDFYVTNSCFGYKNALFHNQRDGSFIDVAAKMGVADLNIAGSGVSMGSV